MNLTPTQQELLKDIKGYGAVEVHGKDIRIARQLAHKHLVFVDQEWINHRLRIKLITVEHMGDYMTRIEAEIEAEGAGAEAALIGSSRENER